MLAPPSQSRPHARAAAAACAAALGLSACNTIFGIDEGTPAPATSGPSTTTGSGGMSSSSGTGGMGAGGSGGAGGNAAGGGPPVCGPSACAAADYEPGGACAASLIYASVGAEDQDLEGTGIISDVPRGRVIWGKGDGSTIVATPFGGGETTVLVSAPVEPESHYPYQMARDDLNLYWITYYDGTISRLALENGIGAIKVAEAPGIGLEKPIALFDGHVFFATQVSSDPADAFCNQPGSTCSDKLFAAPTSGSGEDATIVYEDSNPRFRVGGIASDGSHLYFTTCYEFMNDGRVYRVDGPAGAPVEIATFDAPNSACGEIVVDPGPDGRLYWIGGGTLWTSPKDPPEPAAKAAVGSVSRLVGDDEYLYWISETSQIMRAPKLTNDAAILVGTGVNAFGLAVDCGHVTWTNTPNMNEPGSTIEILSALR